MKLSGKALLGSWLYIALLFAADYFSKNWVMVNIHQMNWLYPAYPYGGIGVFRDFFGVDFSINYVQNTGSAWGLFSDFPTPLMIARTILIGLLLIYQYFYIKKDALAFPITMIVAGAISNLIDSYSYGYVVDMFHFNLWGYHFPVFNVADISICLGVAWMILLSLKETYGSSRIKAG